MMKYANNIMLTHNNLIKYNITLNNVKVGMIYAINKKQALLKAIKEFGLTCDIEIAKD